MNKQEYKDLLKKLDFTDKMDLEEIKVKLTSTQLFHLYNIVERRFLELFGKDHG